MYMRIHCGSCGGTWEVYPRQREYDAARICPHCEKRIAGDTWQNKILPAYTIARNANLAIAADHIDTHSADFEIDFIADGKFKCADKADIMNELYAVKAILEMNNAAGIPAER